MFNVIAVKPKLTPVEFQRKITDAFERNAEVDANHITVEANGGEVVLTGTVRSWIERKEAKRGVAPSKKSPQKLISVNAGQAEREIVEARGERRRRCRAFRGKKRKKWWAMRKYTADGDLILPKNFDEWVCSDRPPLPMR